MGSILWDSTEIFQVPRQTITACLKKLRKVCLHWSGSFESTPKNQVMSVHVCQQLREISSKNSFLKFTKNIITLPQKICYGTPNVWCKITIIQSCEKVQVWTKKRIFLMLLAFKCANFQRKISLGTLFPRKILRSFGLKKVSVSYSIKNVNCKKWVKDDATTITTNRPDIFQKIFYSLQTKLGIKGVAISKNKFFLIPL